MQDYSQPYNPVMQPAQQPAPQQQTTRSGGFQPDANTREILSKVHPELTNAMICLAIKKFSLTEDYLDFFVRDEFKQIVEEIQENSKTEAKKEQVEEVTPQQPQPAQQAAVSFDSW